MPTATKRGVRRVLTFSLGVSWLLLGFLSDQVPWFTERIWILLCSMAAGAAFALAYYTTLFALKRYTAIVLLIGALRSAAYISNGYWGPLLVWLILSITTITAALALVAQPRKGTSGG